MKTTYRIGEVAGKIGVQPESIRYYERIGLLPKPKRGASGYRVFTAEHVERAELIKKMQALGFSLEEIRGMLELKFTYGHSCQHVRNGLREKLEAIDRQIENLKEFRNDVEEALKTCENSLEVHASGDCCPVLQVNTVKTGVKT
jgi:MerR family Zn(II)-responsive transcriptional regulator of zntA